MISISFNDNSRKKEVNLKGNVQSGKRMHGTNITMHAGLVPGEKKRVNRLMFVTFAGYQFNKYESHHRENQNKYTRESLDFNFHAKKSRILSTSSFFFFYFVL